MARGEAGGVGWASIAAGESEEKSRVVQTVVFNVGGGGGEGSLAALGKINEPVQFFPTVWKMGTGVGSCRSSSSGDFVRSNSANSLENGKRRQIPQQQQHCVIRWRQGKLSFARLVRQRGMCAHAVAMIPRQAGGESRSILLAAGGGERRL